MTDYNNALDYSSQWLDIIRQENFPEETQAKWIIEQSTQNFAEHFNRGWLEYRKSVTEAGDWASVEWSGSGSAFIDVMGRKYIDWLGGFGMMDLGWCHPEVVEAVIAQVKRSPMPSQELIDPLRGVLAKLMAEITPKPRPKPFSIPRQPMPEQPPSVRVKNFNEVPYGFNADPAGHSPRPADPGPVSQPGSVELGPDGAASLPSAAQRVLMSVRVPTKMWSAVRAHSSRGDEASSSLGLGGDPHQQNAKHHGNE